MKTNEEAFNPEQSLRVIRETIDLAKGSVRESGFHFLLWGWLVVLAGLIEYFGLPALGRSVHWVWGIMPLIGAPTSIVYEWRRNKLRGPRNIIRDWYGQVWMAFGISLAIVIALSIHFRVGPIPYILLLAGTATFISGTLLRFLPLKLGSMAFWLGALICIPVPVETHILIEVVATILGYLVPGYMLNYNERKKDV
ncbi:MAG: hypothetical protein R2792_06235 [Saprospiraceae bacterium]